MDTAAKTYGAIVSVYRGLANSGTQWASAFQVPGVIGVDAIPFYRLMRSNSGLQAAQMPALSGDVTSPGGSLATTIAYGAVTNVKMAQMAATTIKGNHTGAAAYPADLTPAVVSNMMGLGTMSTQAASAVAVTGGAINGTTIGATTPATVKGTSVTATGVMTGGFNAAAAGTLALAMASAPHVSVTPNATGTFTTTVPPAGTLCTLIINTSGTTSFTMTFGTGFKSQGTLATGTVTGKTFAIEFISDGTNLIETGRTVAM
jgi:hypothetical protein